MKKRFDTESKAPLTPEGQQERLRILNEEEKKNVRAAKAKLARHNMTARALALKHVMETRQQQEEEKTARNEAKDRQSRYKMTLRALNLAAFRNQQTNETQLQVSVATPSPPPVRDNSIDDEDEEEDPQEPSLAQNGGSFGEDNKAEPNKDGSTLVIMPDLEEAIESGDEDAINRIILRAFLEENAPDRLDELDDMLAAYPGVEIAHLFEDLVGEYYQIDLSDSEGIINLPLAVDNLTRVYESNECVMWNKSKLMMIGQGFAGKTSTVNSLLGKPFDENESSTLGVNTEIEIQLEQINAEDWKEKEFQNDETSVQAHRRAAQIYQEALVDESAPYFALGMENDDDSFTEPRHFSALNDEALVENENVVEDNTSHNQEFAKRFDEKMFLQALENGNEMLEFTIWDYGGQSVFYTLHHVFLTSYGIYMLCFNLDEFQKDKEKELQTLKFWLNSVKLHAKDTPVFLVGTHLDVLQDDPQTELKRINIELQKSLEIGVKHKKRIIWNEQERLCFFPVDNKNRVGIEALKIKTEQVVRESKYVKIQVPLTWIKVLDGVRALQMTHMKHEDFVNFVVSRFAIDATGDEMEKMLEYFHELGCLLHFSASPMLREYVIIDPQWLIDGLTCLIFDNVHWENKPKIDVRLELQFLEYQLTGILDEELKHSLWAKFTEEIDYLEELMRVMYLLCDWQPSKEKILVPSMVATERLENSVDDKFTNGIEARLDFSEFCLPDGVFQRILSICIEYAHRQEQYHPPLLARYDCVLNFGSWCSFRMRIDPFQSDQIAIQISKEDQDHAPKLIKLLYSMFEKLNDDFMGRRLKWKLLVSTKEKTDPPIFHEFNSILDLLQAQKEEYVVVSPVLKMKISEFQVWIDPDQGDLTDDATVGENEFLDQAQTDLHEAQQEVINRVDMHRNLPPGMKYHVFISYKQSNAVDAVRSLYYQLTMQGWICWLDMEAKDLTQGGISKGIETSAVYLLFLSKGVFRRKNVRLEAEQAVIQEKPIILIHESDTRLKQAYSTISKYKRQAPDFLLPTFDEVESIAFQRRNFLVESMIDEISRRLEEYIDATTYSYP